VHGYGDAKGKALTSPIEERPREIAYVHVLERLATLNARATLECREPTCGERDKDGEVISCSSKHCGEKLMRDGWRRELSAMRYMKELIEWADRFEIKKAAEEDKKTKGKRS
jgi:hypothetical protein